MLRLPQEEKCALCGQSNPDVLEDHLVTFSEDYDYNGPTIVMRLCVNCHRAIHRCCWTLISEDSEAILKKYFAFLKSSLPRSLAQILQEELLAAKESVTKEYQRVEGYNPEEQVQAEKKCALCGCSNPDFIEEHELNPSKEYIQLKNSPIINLCGNCHRIVLKFREGKVLPTSEQSKKLLQKYLAQFREHLPEGVRNRLIEFLS